MSGRLHELLDQASPDLLRSIVRSFAQGRGVDEFAWTVPGAVSAAAAVVFGAPPAAGRQALPGDHGR
jgi:hypothetical protein